MAKYLTITLMLFSIGIGLAIRGAPQMASPPEPDLDIVIEPLDGVFSEERQQALCAFDADFVTLYLRDTKNVQRVRHNFCSAYQRAKAKLIRDGRGRNYVFLEHGEGRGTNATTYFLSVFRVVDDQLRLVTKTEIGWAIDSQAGFSYAYVVHPTRSGGLELIFQGEPSGKLVHPCCIPLEWNRVVRIDAN